MTLNAALRIRPERPPDLSRIRELNRLAFGGIEEADIVDAIRSGGGAVLSLVAVAGDDLIVGHILFSPVTLVPPVPELRGLGLGPMAVLPSWQNRGIGTRLVEEGMRHCVDLAVDYVVVLGHPAYYPRFGFLPSVSFNLKSAYDAPPEAFMVRELREGSLREHSGVVHYRPEFGGG